MRSLEQSATLEAGASWVQARALDIAAVLSRPFLAWVAARREQLVRPVSYVSRSPQNYSYCPAIITAQRRKKP